MTTTRERVAAAVESALPARISDDLSPAEADAIADVAIRAMSEEVEAAYREGYQDALSAAMRGIDHIGRGDEDRDWHESLTRDRTTQGGRP